LIDDFADLKEYIISEPVYSILKNLSLEIGCNLYLVGGCIRDVLMGKREGVVDMDFSSNSALKLARMFSRKTRGTFVLLDEEEETGRVVIKDKNREFVMDFSRLKGNTIEEDIYKRDFTINAIAISFQDFFSGKINIIDPSGGMADIKKRLIRKVSSEVFIDDPLRILRAFRFAATLKFEITPDTASLINLHREKIRAISFERVEAELFKILEVEYNSPYFKEMENLGIPGIIMPEMNFINKDNSEDIFHSYAKLEEVISWKYREIFPDFSSEITDYLNRPYCKSLVKLAFFLCNLEETPSSLPGEICRRLKMSNYKVETISKLVSTCVFIKCFIEQIKEKGYIENSLILNFFRKSDTDGTGTLLIGFAREREDEKLLTGIINTILKVYFYRIKAIRENPRLINGNDLLKIFGLKPGPIFKEILEMIEEKQLDGEIKSRDDACRFIENLIREKRV